MLRDLRLEQVYESSTSHLVGDLITPLMKESKDYLRGVGYFSSGWLREASEGIAALVGNGGRGRIVTSPILSLADWEAISRGGTAKADELILRSLSTSVDDLRDSLRSDTLNCLAWLISDGLLEMRFAVPRPGWKDGDYHDKVWVFEDETGDRVALHGSFNDSIKGTLNGEGISVFKSWIEGQQGYVLRHRQRLEALWNGTNDQFETKSLPDAIKDKIVKLRTTPERPYSLPADHPLLAAERRGPYSAVSMRPYQLDAIEKWVAADREGIWEMATGTGKTFTALAAAVGTYKDLGRVACVILVPYRHLLEQWERHSRQFGFDPVMCSSDYPKWRIELSSAVRDFRLGMTDSLCVLAVHNTAAGDDFIATVAPIPEEHLLVVGDEVHELGASHMRRAMLPDARMHLGLSATPRRWMDPHGTQEIERCFGEVCFDFDLDKAIEAQFLTEYDYSPEIVHLTEDEQDLYDTLSSEISRLAVLLRQPDPAPGLKGRLEKKLRDRAKLIWGASNKLPLLCNRLADLMKAAQAEGRRPQHILVYCAPGEHRAVLKRVSELGFRAHEFVHSVSLRDRADVLNRFEQGELELLVAIRCLDQGVDVPATRTAFMLASTTNPRQFVQRRGRVLRTVSGKTHADIHDFLVFPRLERAQTAREMGQGMLRREMPRFAEFSLSARNMYKARQVAWDTLDAYHALSMLDQRPWDVYADMVKDEQHSVLALDPLYTGEDE